MSAGSLDKIVSDYYTISRMDISIVDRDFRSLSIRRGKDDLCSLLHRDRVAIDRCKESDIEQLSYVKETHSPMLYSCPFGITEAIVPIIRDGETIGYIISTVGIRSSSEDDIKVLCSDLSIRSDHIDRMIDSSRKVTDEEISSHFNMLQILADYIANDQSLINENESIGRLIKKFIKGNIAGKLTLNELARNLHCSTVTLTEHFKREFGITINEYITSKRMEHSERLMLSTDKPLREIATLSGFADVEYFSRTFKKHHGISPALWRKIKGKELNADT
ncbi:MAG: PocR ligand-binding domain-containing protein [Clostridia bacterium]|nr:PocR ligand-binding domain-containing protein [Clostridia bacterium]